MKELPMGEALMKELYQWVKDGCKITEPTFTTFVARRTKLGKLNDERKKEGQGQGAGVA